MAAWVLIGTVQAAGLLTPSDGSLPALTLKDHHVDVVIEDGYAITRVEQVFHNPHPRDLEAHYSFPVPEKGAVSEFTLWIDGKPVVGEVLEKQQARQVYEQEKSAGRDAGLTEQDGYRTFDVFVSPVRASADTRVRLVYMQPAHVDTGIGRYVYPLEEGGVDEARLAFWTANETVSGSFTFNVHLRSAYPVDAVRIPGRPGATVTQVAEGEWRVQLINQAVDLSADASGRELATDRAEDTTAAVAGTPSFRLDRDLVVYWRHRPGLPGSVDLVTHKPDANGRGTFMMVVTPGEDLQPITEGRDWVFVLDISGSMQGKYATLADGVQRALQKLRAGDRFRIILFNDGVRELTQGFANATAENVNRYSQAVAGISPGGGTNLYRGLAEGLDALDADRSSGVILVTDGVANVGEVEHRQFLKLIARKDVRLFTMVMGNSANRPLLDAMTRESGGFALSISNSDDIVGQLLTATGKLTHEALHGVRVSIDGIKTADLAPQTLGTLYRGQQLVVFGHYWGDGSASVELEGRRSGERIAYRTQFAFPAVSQQNPEIERLWAFASIEDLNQQIADFGEQADTRQAIVDIATEHGLVTDYTSMLVVRDEVFEQHGIARNNRQRVATEQAAQQQRSQQAPVSRRVDTQQPMYSGTRASHGGSGGGSIDFVAVLLMLPLVWLALRRRPMAGG
ncbi:MAG: VWA domain-containing protein [Gammaproteobacteria bacterium]|nr:VWA domain-containing protein [Gammaproteobacteria bacterium]